MNRSSRCNGIALLVLALLVGCGGHATSTDAAHDEALTALKSLRNNGVLSEAEYQAKLATLQGSGSAGLGDGGSVGENAGTAEATRALGLPDNGVAGLSTTGNEFAGGPPVRPASNANAYTSGAQHAPRAVHNRLATRADSQPDERAGASQNGNAHINPMRSLLTKARAAQDAMSRSAHDLALRIRDGASHANSSAGQRTLTNQGAQALQSAGQEWLRSGAANASPGDAANQGSGTPPQR